MRDFKREIDLKQYLPPVSRDSRDIQAVMETENVELKELWDVMCQLLTDQFIRLMDEYSTEQWESILKLTKLDGMTLAKRRQEVLKTLRGQRPYTIRSFRRILKNIYGNNVVDVQCKNDKYELWITIEPLINYRVEDIRELADRIIPMNLLIFIQELRTSTVGMYIGGTVRVDNEMTAQGGTIPFDTLQNNQFSGGYVRVSSTHRTGGL